VINEKTGELAFRELTISPKTKESELVSKVTFKQIGGGVFGHGTLTSDAHRFGTCVWFSDGSPSSIWLQLLNSDEPEWSLEAEFERKKLQEDFMARELRARPKMWNGRDPNYLYSWGSISSVIDVKGVQALIIVSYNR
jgi:hypothetical protein